MKVVLDATAGARGDPSGVGRYVHELVRALAGSAEVPPFELGVRFSKWRGRGALPTTTGDRRVRVRVLDDRLDWLLLRGVDLFHGLDARITPSRKLARIATLHDLFSMERDDLARDDFRDMKRRRYRQLADEADAIVCVSQTTEERFLGAFPAARGRTYVIRHGVSARFERASAEVIAAVRRGRKLSGPFIAFVGLLSTRKNLLALLDAFADLGAKRENLTLVLAGAPSHGHDAIEAAIAKHPYRSRIRTLGFVPDGELPALYSAAELLVFPSLTEGFGLPVLEAYACGTPVVANNLPVLREVGGPELRVADAKDPHALASTIESALALPPDLERRERLVAHARSFSWDDAARKTVAVWIAALERHRQRVAGPPPPAPVLA
jgi:glycosyltransferase involved in cell wall biosynthesis